MMISKIQKDFLLLFQCIVDFGAEVLRDFTEEKIKIKYKTENFSIFLENTKHYFYHQWEKTKVPCCQCPVHGFNIPKAGRMDKTIYNKLYSFNSSEKCPKGHVIKKDSIIVQTCICRFTAGNIMINELDLSDLNALLVGLRAINTPIICQSEALLIIEIMVVRGTVCHAVTTTTFSESELNNLWIKFTNALYSLCPGDKKNVKWLKKTIETTKKTILSEEEVQELMGKIDMQERDIQDISEAVKKIMINKTAELKNCVINESAGIKAHLDSTIQPFNDKQEKHSELLLGHQFDTIDQMKKSEERFIELKDLVKVLIERDGWRSFHLQARPSDIRTQSSSESVPGNRDILLTCTVAQPSLTKEMEQNIIDSLPNEIDVTIDEENDEDNPKQTLKIKSKKVNSIVLEIHATCKIFQSPSELRSAICALVEMVLGKGEVDKNAEDPILVTLSFESILTEDEKATVINLLTTKYELINEGPNTRPKNVNAEETIEENDIATHLSAPSEHLSDSGIDRSENLALNEDFSCILFDLVQLEESLKDLMEELDISKRMWLAVGISLYTIIANVLRIYVNKCFSELYESMVTSDNIETQMFPNYIKMYHKSNIQLNYEEINRNKIIHGNEIHKYDYKVRNPVDLSKLFLPTGIAQYQDFQLTCSLSSLFEIINHVDIFKDDVKDISREVESNISKIWARSDVTKWDEFKFLSSFMLMEKFVTKLQLEGDEKSILENLKRWENFANNTPLYAATNTKQEQASTVPTDNISDTPLYADPKTKQDKTRTTTTGVRHIDIGPQFPIFCLSCKRKTETINIMFLKIGQMKRCIGTCALCKRSKSMFV